VISEDRLEKAMRFLAETDEELAEAKGEVLRCEQLLKRIQYRLFKSADGSIELRKATAGVSEETARAEEELVSAIVQYEKLKAKRETESTVVEVWRTLESSRRKGL